MNLTTLPRDPDFWDTYAPWYERWLLHSFYHHAIIGELSRYVESGWRVMDVGAGTGVLSMPMAALGCTVEAVEPSAGMRGIFEKKLISTGVEGVSIRPERWEDCHMADTEPHDLIVACNSLHLTEGGIQNGMEKVFASAAENVCLVTEINQDIFIDFKEIHEMQGGYDFMFIKQVTVDSGFEFGNMEEVVTLSDLIGREIPVTEEDRIIHRDSADVAIVFWERK
jgi:hypothetical protein